MLENLPEKAQHRVVVGGVRSRESRSEKELRSEEEREQLTSVQSAQHTARKLGSAFKGKTP